MLLAPFARLSVSLPPARSIVPPDSTVVSTTVSADRKSVVEGKSVDLGGRRIIKKKTQYVDLFGVREHLERPIDRGEADPLAPMAEQVVDLLRRTEVVDLLQKR